MPSADAAIPATRNAGVSRVLAGILVANLLVVAIKFGVGVGVGSLAVLGDAIHSSVDVINNLFGLAMIRVAAKAPDADHPYGHAKFETLGALVIVVLLSVSIFELGRGAVARLAGGGSPPSATPLDLLLLLATLAVNVGVVAYETRAARRLRSELLLADALHTRADVFITIAVLAGLALADAGYHWADPVLALIVAVLVARAGYEIVRRAIPTLVDERAFDADVIRQEAERVTGVRAAYDIRSRTAASIRFAELTIAVPGDADVASAHRVADAVEQHLRERLEMHDVVVHVEPC